MPDCRFCKKYWDCQLAQETKSEYFNCPCDDYVPYKKRKFKSNRYLNAETLS